MKMNLKKNFMMKMTMKIKESDNEFEWNNNQAESIDDDLVTLENQVQEAKIKRKKQLEKELKEIQDKLK